MSSGRAGGKSSAHSALHEFERCRDQRDPRFSVLVAREILLDIVGFLPGRIRGG